MPRVAPVMKLIAVTCLLSASALNAASIRLTWTPSSNSTTADPGTVNVYRRTATCPSQQVRLAGCTWQQMFRLTVPTSILLPARCIRTATTLRR
jgi:hypothetical protein